MDVHPALPWAAVANVGPQLAKLGQRHAALLGAWDAHRRAVEVKLNERSIADRAGRNKLLKHRESRGRLANHTAAAVKPRFVKAAPPLFA